MSATRGVSSRFTAVKGLITEQNDCNFEVDSMIAAENVIPDKTGRVSRRRGVDVVGSAISVGVDAAQYGAVSKFTWMLPNKVWNTDLLVIQIGAIVYFFSKSETMTDSVLWQLDLTPYALDINTVVSTECSFAEAGGHLFIANSGTNPLCIRMNDDATFTVVKQLDIKVRVMECVQSGSYAAQGIAYRDPRERPVYGTSAHYFDLRNAGWPVFVQCALNIKGGYEHIGAKGTGGWSNYIQDLEYTVVYTGSESSTNGIVVVSDPIWDINRHPQNEKGAAMRWYDPLKYTFYKLQYFPALCDTYQQFKTASAEAVEALDCFSPWEIQKNEVSSGIPPVGHYITSAFSFNMGQLLNDENAMYQNVDTVKYDPLIGYDKNLVLSTNTRPNVVSALNGHLLLAGKLYNGSQVIFYSQLLTNIQNCDKCYQEADPTAAEINDVVATDGGTLSLIDMPEIVHMEEGMGGVLIFTQKGIWLLSGDSDLGFSAISNRVTKISDIACLGAQSIVKYNDQWFFWNRDGLHVLHMNEYGRPVVDNLTRNTIQTVVGMFNEHNMKHVSGDVDKLTGKIYFTMPTYNGQNCYLNRYASRIILTLDSEIGGFYYHTVSDAGPYMVSPIVVGGLANVEYDAAIYSEEGSLITDGSVIVVAKAFYQKYMPEEFNVLCLDDAGNAYFAKHTTTFYDWEVYSGVENDYTSFAEFAHKRDNNLSANTRITAVQSFFEHKRVEPVLPYMGDVIPQ